MKKNYMKLWSGIIMGLCSMIILSACEDDNDDLLETSNTVGLLSTSPQAVEGNAAEFEVIFFGFPEDQPGDIAVDYSVEGTGVSLTGSVTIPDGEQTAPFTITIPENDQISLDTIELSLSLTSASNGVPIKDDLALNSHTFELVDDIKNISITNDTTDLSEDFSLSGDTLKIPINITGELDSEITLDYIISGDATPMVDYELLSANPLVLPAGTSEASINFLILDDTDNEPAEELSLTIDNLSNSNPSDTETNLLEDEDSNDALYRNIVYNIVDDTKTIGFSFAPIDTIKVATPGDYIVDLELDGSLVTPVNATFDDNLPPGVSDNISDPTNTVSIFQDESQRIITFTVNESAFAGFTDVNDPNIVGTYEIVSTAGDDEFVIGTSNLLVFEIINPNQ